MPKPTDALVTGFVKSPQLLEKSLAPLRRLKQEDVIRDIHYVTWDSVELDSFIAPVSTMKDIRLTRVPQPDAKGTGFQRGVIYQVRNLEAGLSLIPDGKTRILKWRPDFVADCDFLRDKIVNFERLCAVPSNSCYGVAMPPHVFQHKLWIPWADSNQPFFYEDAVFLGVHRDAQKLVTDITDDDLDILGDSFCGNYCHVVRYGKIFLKQYPLFGKFLENFHYFLAELVYRMRLIPFLTQDGFYWHVLVAHAWILHSQFHVDIGRQGQLSFYANAVNRDADWSNLDSLTVTTPYDDVEGWRDGNMPGKVFPSINRAFGRLMDDSWQRALFTEDLPDLPRDTIRCLLGHIAGCADGRLSEIETQFYKELDRLYHRYRPAFRASV